MTTSVSVVVPVLNAAGTIGELHARAADVMSTLPGGAAPWELILVNDGSGDESWERIVGLSESHPEARGLDLARNFGQHNALLAGLHAARLEAIVTLDDDLQNPPEEIPKLLAELARGHDLVYGIPIDRRQPAYRRIGGATVRTTLAALTRRRDALLASGFRALRREVAGRLPETAGKRVALDSLLRAQTDRIGSVAVGHEPRRMGRSNYSLAMLASHTITSIRTDLRLGGHQADDRPSYAIRAVTGTGPADGGR